MEPKTDPTAPGGMPAAGTAPAGVTPPVPAPAPAAGSTGSAGVTPAPGVTPPAPAPAATPAAPAAPAATTPDDLAGLRSALDAERKARDKAEKELKKRDDAELSEVDRLKKQLGERDEADKLRDAAEKESRVKVAAIGAAARLGFADPDDALRLMDRNAIKFDDATGQPTNVAELTADILKTKPYLASAAARPAGSIDLGGGGTTPAYTKEQLAKMTPEQIADNWPAIMAATGGKLPT